MTLKIHNHIQKYPILTNANIPWTLIILDMHSYCNVHYSLIADSSKLAVFRFGVPYMLTMQLLSLWLADAAPILHSRFIRPGTGPIFLDDVDCRGNKTNLEDCPHRGVGDHNCIHWQEQEWSASKVQFCINVNVNVCTDVASCVVCVCS